MEANLTILNERSKFPFIPDLIARKTAGSEQERLSDDEKTFHRQEFERLRAELEFAGTQSNLPENPEAQTELNALLVALRRTAS